MSIKHEDIKYSSALPFKVFTFKAKNLDRIIKPHWHQSTEILYCIEGNLKINFPEKTYILEKSQFIVINPNQIHSTQSLSHNFILCIELPLTLMNVISKNTFMNNFIFDTDKCINHPSNYSKIKSSLDALLIHNASDENIILKDLDMTCDIYQLIRSLISKNAILINNKYVGSNTEFAEKVINYIDKNCQRNISLSDIASACSYSTSYTSRMIKKNLGTTFSDLLISIRLSKAVTLIKNSKYNNLTLIEIANATGFKNYRNFYNCFENAYHISPGKFRNNLDL